MKINKVIYTLLLIACMASCQENSPKRLKEQAIQSTDSSKNFGADRAFLKDHVEVVELADGDARVLIVPQYQARVMTSTCQGDLGVSFGWINYDLIASNKYAPHINAYGGEERFWLGPEGGQFGLFFKKGDSFNIRNWQTPAVLDTVTFDVIKKQSGSASFTKTFEIENNSGYKFHVNLERNIQLVSKAQAEAALGLALSDVKFVGYETRNVLKNVGEKNWDKSTGLLSVWLLSMMNASPQTTVVIPYKSGGAPQVNDRYFGKVPASRLEKRDSFLLFQADAKFRSKIGIPPSIVKPVSGSYDSKKNILTIIEFDYNGAKDYVNSMWEQQADPFSGDALNAYNDGPNDTGTQLGAFYEMESSSPAVALRGNQSLTHSQRIFHFYGEKVQLNLIAQKLLHVNLDQLAFK